MDERIEYRGHIIFWQKPLGGAKWAAGFTSGCPSLFPAVEPIEAEAIQGHSCADMVVNAMRYIDGLLDRLRSSAIAFDPGLEPADSQGPRRSAKNRTQGLAELGTSAILAAIIGEVIAAQCAVFSKADRAAIATSSSHRRRGGDLTRAEKWQSERL